MDSSVHKKAEYVPVYCIGVVSLLHLMANDAVPHTICSTAEPQHSHRHAVDLQSITPSDYRNVRGKKKQASYPPATKAIVHARLAV